MNRKADTAASASEREDQLMPFQSLKDVSTKNPRCAGVLCQPDTNESYLKGEKVPPAVRHFLN